MIQLTESAAGKVKELLVEEGRADIALRVAVQPGGCSGLRYAMYLDDQLSDKDVAEEQFGVRVVIDKMSGPHLADELVLPERRERLGEIALETDRPLRQRLALQDVDVGERRGGDGRVARVGVSVTPQPGARLPERLRDGR